MNLVNKPPYMGLNCINRLLFATTLLCELASQKISLKCNTLNLFKAFGTLKKKLNKANALASQMTLFVIYSCRNNKYMGLIRKYYRICLQWKVFYSQLTFDKAKAFHPLMQQCILQHGGFGHGTFHETVVKEKRKDDEQSPLGHWNSLPSLKMIKFI